MLKKGTCLHFNGIQNKLCEKGVNYRKLVGGEDFGMAVRTPCFKKHKSSINCDLYQDPTIEQIKEDEDSWNTAIERLQKVLPLLVKLKEENPNGGSGTQECPCCNKDLQWSISSINNHGRLVCESENCINMIE